jgi:hypothetical protein
MIVQSILFYFDDIHSLLLSFFCLAHFSNDRWQMMWFHIQS